MLASIYVTIAESTYNPVSQEGPDRFDISNPKSDTYHYIDHYTRYDIITFDMKYFDIAT
jgi:hypothetical protein